MRNLSNKNVIHIKGKGIEYLQFRKLLEYEDIISHAYSLGIDVGFNTTIGNKQQISTERTALAKKSYRNMCNDMGCDDTHIVKANQNHTDIIRSIQKKINVNETNFIIEDKEFQDGLITNKKNIMLATINADCILLLFFDPVKKVIANTHSGWRGTLQRISVKTIQKMINEYECKPQNIICCICPSIRKCHFEVDKDVKDMFEKEFLDLENARFIDIEKENKEKLIQIKDFIEEKKENIKWNIDTVLINKILLQKEGLRPNNIIDSGICSVCNSDIIHSYRVEKDKYNTETAVIELK